MILLRKEEKRTMKRLITLLLIISILSCQEQESTIESIDAANLTTEQIDSILTEFKFQYESPIVLDSTNQVLIPISTQLLERRTKYNSSGYDSGDYPRYWNILFYNRETGDTRLLTEDKIRISQIYTNHILQNEYEEQHKLMKTKVLYEITDIDYNKDNKLNEWDPEYLFSSEIDGANLQRVSPPNEDLQYFKVIPNSRQILIRTLRDINQDSIFNREDESIWYKSELKNSAWELEELIDSTKRKKIENLYFEQWLKKK